MPRNEGSLAGLPPSLLGVIIRSAANHGRHHQLAALNLACHATHKALPKAFASQPPDAELEDIFLAESSATDAQVADTGCTFGRPSPGAPGPHLTLRLDLDRLGAAALAGVPPSAVLLPALRHTARRFADTRRLHLLLTCTQGMIGGYLFAEHVAPHLLGVQHLFIQGPPDFSLPPFWRAPTAAAFSARITQLSVTAHHSGVAPLAAQLPAAFPSLTALSLTLDTYQADVECCKGRIDNLTLALPPHLRVLLLRFTERASELEPDGRPTNGDYTFTLTLTGGAGTLHRLGIHSSLCSDTDDGVLYHPRPVLLAGHQPALRHVDVPMYPCLRWASAQLANSLGQLCPNLTKLVLCTWSGEHFGARHCAAFVEGLAPLAGSLTLLEVQHEGEVGFVGTDVQVGPLTLGPLVARWLPATELHILHQAPTF